MNTVPGLITQGRSLKFLPQFNCFVCLVSDTFNEKRTYLVSAMKRWLVCENVSFSFDEIIAQTNKLFFIGSVQKSAKNDKRCSASTCFNRRLSTVVQVTRSNDHNQFFQ